MPDSNQHRGRHREGAAAGRNSLVELVVIVASAIGFALLIQAFIVKPFRIPSTSMVPTLQVGQRVLVNRVDGRFGNPERGDVTVFNPPTGAGTEECGVGNGDQYLPGRVYRPESESNPEAPKMPCPKPTAGKHNEAFIKRVIALPGERLKVIKGHAYINGKKLNEPYINPVGNCDDPDSFGSGCTFSLEVVIPPDHYFMMGDNRGEGQSFDSRFWGPVPQQNIVGEAFATYWPPKRIGTL